MWLSYSENLDSFCLACFKDEISYPIEAGFKRVDSQVYSTDNWSIASRFIFWADKRTKKVLEKWKPRQNKIDQIKTSPAVNNKKYMPHQIKGMAFLLKRERVLLADEQRVGKTVTTCGAINSLHFNAGFKRFLIVVPDNLRPTWRRESKEWSYTEGSVLSNKNPVDLNFNGIYIVNYANLKKFLPMLLKWKPEYMVVDEAHKITNPQTMRYKCVKELNKIAKRAVFLTGTPFSKATTQESFHLFHLISEEHFDCYQYFNERLKQYFKEFVLRRTRAEVYKVNPQKHRKYVMLDAKGLEKEVKAELGAYYQESGGDKINFADFSRARRELAIKKIPILVPLVEDYVLNAIKEGRKTLIVGYHREVIKGMTDYLQSIGVKAVAYLGGMSDKSKDNAYQSFQNGDAEVMVASIRSASEGLTVTAAKDVLILELDYVPVNIQQMEDRVVLFNQTHLFYTYYIVEGSYDLHTINALHQKQLDTNTLFQQTNL